MGSRRRAQETSSERSHVNGGRSCFKLMGDGEANACAMRQHLTPVGSLALHEPA